MVMLKLRMEPWMTPTNHLLSSNLLKCLPIRWFQKNFLFEVDPVANACLDRLRLYLNEK